MSQEQLAPSSHKTTVLNRLDWPLILFFSLAFAIAWGIIPALSFIARHSGISDWQTLSRMGETFNFDEVALVVPKWLVYLLTRLQDFAFTIAGLIVIGITQGGVGLREVWRKLTHWQVSWQWYLAALLPFGLYAIATLVANVNDSFTLSAKTVFYLLFSLEAGFLVTFFLRGAMGEEIGLRGFALPRLQATMTPFKASIIIGILWAVWHLPVLIQQNLVSIIAFLLLAFLLSFIFTWLFNRSQQSLIPVLIFHAAQNSEELFETLFPSLIGTDWELVSALGLLLVGTVIAVHLWRTRHPK